MNVSNAPKFDVYKISIHHSYRENGKVKKKQWSICTMSYYDIVEYSFEDMIVKTVLDAKIAEMGVERSQFYRMVYDKLNPLEDTIRAEYEQTEEYKTHQEHRAILNTHWKVKIEFEKLYGKGTYSRIYDVYGNLRNEEYLKKVIADKEAEEVRQKEYRKRSEEEFFKRFNQDYGSSSGSHSTASNSNYSDVEKKLLHEIYRMASKKFHPDACGDDGSKMKFLTKLKEQWGL